MKWYFYFFRSSLSYCVLTSTARRPSDTSQMHFALVVAAKEKNSSRKHDLLGSYFYRSHTFLYRFLLIWWMHRCIIRTTPIGEWLRAPANSQHDSDSNRGDRRHLFDNSSSCRRHSSSRIIFTLHRFCRRRLLLLILLQSVFGRVPQPKYTFQRSMRFLTISSSTVPSYIQYNEKGTAYDTLSAHLARYDTIRDDAGK